MQYLDLSRAVFILGSMSFIRYKRRITCGKMHRTNLALIALVGISVSISKIDGRQQRSERSRQQIIDAMRKLVEVGIYIPTAKQVADKAEVNIRTVFRHFSDMDKLYYEIDQILRPNYNRHFVGQDSTGALEQRIRLVVEARISCYVETYAMEKATHALLWRSKLIAETYQGLQHGSRRNLVKMLPELKKTKAETRETVDAVTSFEFFERLQMHQDLTEKACKKLIYNLVLDLLTK